MIFGRKFYRKYWLIFCSFILFGQAIRPDENPYTPVAVSLSKNLYQPEKPLENQQNLAGALGAFNRPGFYGGFDYLSTRRVYWGSFFIPSEVGVWGINYMHSQGMPNPDGTFGLLRLGFGKGLTPNLFFGFFLNYAYSSAQNHDNAVGFEPSLIYSFSPAVAKEAVLAAHTFFFYFAGQNLGYDLRNTAMQTPRLLLGTGINFLKVKDFSIVLQGQSSLDVGMQTLPFSFGLSLQYLYFQIRGGYAFSFPLGSSKVIPGDFSLGGGITGKFSGFMLTAEYGVKGLTTPNPEHYFSVGALFDYHDTKVPKLAVKTNYNYISPNGDGVRDYVEFKISVSPLRQVKDWQLLIKNDRGEVVKTFKKDKRDKSVFFPVYRIFTELFLFRQYRFIPQKIYWDGTADHLNATISPKPDPPSITLPDGTYFYEMTVTDTSNLTSEPAKGSIVIDNTAPEVILKRAYVTENNLPNIFLALSQYTSSQSEDLFSGEILDESGNVVRSYHWNGARSVPVQFFWNGNDDKEARLPEGSYSYRLTASDLAGNKTQIVIPDIFIYDGRAHVNITSATDGFSPNNDGRMDNFDFNVNINNIGDIRKWSVWVVPQGKKIDSVKDMEHYEPLMSWSGDSKDVPGAMTWNGKNSYGIMVPDGHYKITAFVETAKGEFYFSPAKLVVVDTKAPEIFVYLPKSGLTPDGDGEDDSEFIRISSGDSSEIKDYSIFINEVNWINGKKVEVPFKKWSSASGVPEKLFFNGISDKGVIMESLHQYYLRTEISDIYGNVYKHKLKTINTDVLVNLSKSGYRITLSGIHYDKLNRASALDFEKLFRVFRVLLTDYPGYKVRIESYTGDVEGEKDSLAISEERAKYINRLFTQWGMSKKKTGYQGYGQVLPLSDYPDELSNYKNDRLEFALVK